MHFGMVLGDRHSQVLEQRRLAGLGRRDDEAALAPADGRDQVDHAQARLRAGRVARQTERLVRVDRDQVLEVRQRSILFGRETARLLNLYQGAASATTVTGQADDLRSVAQAEVPRDLRRNHDVVTRRKVVLGCLPQEPAGALIQIHDACDLCGRACRRDRNLSRVPRSALPLLIRLLGPARPVVTMVSMAPRVPRAVPHGRPALRELSINSSSSEL